MKTHFFGIARIVISVDTNGECLGIFETFTDTDVFVVLSGVAITKHGCYKPEIEGW